jgi:hypothetical protein
VIGAIPTGPGTFEATLTELEKRCAAIEATYTAECDAADRRRREALSQLAVEMLGDARGPGLLRERHGIDERVPSALPSAPRSPAATPRAARRGRAS